MRAYRNLLDLPDEILQEIIFKLINDTICFKAIGATCKRLKYLRDEITGSKRWKQAQPVRALRHKNYCAITNSGSWCGHLFKSDSSITRLVLDGFHVQNPPALDALVTDPHYNSDWIKILEIRYSWICYEFFFYLLGVFRKINSIIFYKNNIHEMLVRFRSHSETHSIINPKLDHIRVLKLIEFDDNDDDTASLIYSIRNLKHLILKECSMKDPPVWPYSYGDKYFDKITCIRPVYSFIRHELVARELDCSHIYSHGRRSRHGRLKRQKLDKDLIAYLIRNRTKVERLILGNLEQPFDCNFILWLLTRDWIPSLHIVMEYFVDMLNSFDIPNCLGEGIDNLLENGIDVRSRLSSRVIERDPEVKAEIKYGMTAGRAGHVNPTFLAKLLRGIPTPSSKNWYEYPVSECQACLNQSVS